MAKGIRWLLWGELARCAAAGLGVPTRVRETYRGLSFGGFMELFLLMLLVPCALALAGCIALHRHSLRTGRLRYSLIASVLQLLAPLPWLGLLVAFGYSIWTPDIGAYWCEWAMAAGAAAGVLGFAACLLWMVAAYIKEKRSDTHEAV